MEATDRPGTNGVRQEAGEGAVPTKSPQSVPEAFTFTVALGAILMLPDEGRSIRLTEAQYRAYRGVR